MQGVSKAWKLRPRRSHSSSVQTTFKESMIWARKKPLAGAGRQAGLGMLAPQVVKTLYLCLSGHSCQESWGKRMFDDSSELLWNRCCLFVCSYLSLYLNVRP